jgi:hypothetical protein
MVERLDKMVSDLDPRLENNFGVEGHLLLTGYLFGLLFNLED